MSNKVELERVTKAYGDVVVLNEVDLAVSDHDVVCLIGSSGSGKSTLLKCVDLLLPLEGGRILLDGDDITAEHVNPDGYSASTPPMLVTELWSCWNASGWPTRQTTTPTVSPAVSSSVWRSSGRSPVGPS